MFTCSDTSATFNRSVIFNRPAVFNRSAVFNGSAVFNSSALPEPVDQFSSRAMDPSLDRPERDIQGVGNLRVTELLLVKQEKRPAILGSQVSERQMHFLGQLTTGVVIWRVVHDQFFRQFTRWPATTRGKRRPAAVAGNRQQPRLK